MCVSFTLKVVGERNKFCELLSNSKSKSVLLITDDISPAAYSIVHRLILKNLQIST